MFPVAHGWLLAQIAPAASPAAYLGCVWPDMLFGSPLTHPQSHKSGDALLAFARTLPAGAERDEFIAFVYGVLTHGSEPLGFDWFSDERYGGASPEAKGFAFQRAAPLAERAAVACDVAPEDGLWKAHNLIEMAFERFLFAANTQAAAAISAACVDAALMARIAGPLAQHFRAEPEALIAAIRRYSGMVSLAPTSLDDLAQAYARQVPHRHPGAQPNVAALADLIGEAETLIAAERAEYLNVCLAGVQATLAAREL